jgi:hypothetical protein
VTIAKIDYCRHGAPWTLIIRGRVAKMVARIWPGVVSHAVVTGLRSDHGAWVERCLKSVDYLTTSVDPPVGTEGFIAAWALAPAK